MDSSGITNQQVLQCELHSNSKQLLYCNDCECMVCAMCCVRRNAPHHTHDCIDLQDAGTRLRQIYQHLLRTVDEVRQSTAPTIAERQNYSSEVAGKAKQALKCVNKLIDSAINQLEAIRLTLAVEIQTLAARKNLECTSKMQLQQQRRLRFASDRLSQKVTGVLQGSLSEQIAKQQQTSDECKQFERTYRDFEMQTQNLQDIAVDEQTVQDLETLVDNCRTVASRINEHYKRVETAMQSDAIFVVGCGDQSKGTLAYNLANRKWCSLADTMQVRTHAAATGWKNKLIVTGGYKCLNSAEQYDPETNSWSSFPELLTGRYRHASVNLNGELFLIGGCAAYFTYSSDASSSFLTNSVERFDEQTQQWTGAPSLVEARVAAAAASTSRSIIVIGGCDTLFKCEMFDPTSNQWKPIAESNIGRYDAAAASAADMVYVFGGRNQLGYVNDVEQYNEIDNKWTVVGTGKVLGYLAAVSSNDRIYLVSGYAHRIEAFDAETQKFVQVALFPPGCSTYGSAASLALSTKTLSRLQASVLYSR